MERRTYTVTGQKASPEEIDRLIETGESETIFAKAILEQGRGHVRTPLPDLRAQNLAARTARMQAQDQEVVGRGAHKLPCYGCRCMLPCHAPDTLLQC